MGRGAAVAPLWILAATAIGFVLYWFRSALTPFAMALVLWLLIDSVARAIRFAPRWLALSLALSGVLGAIAGVGVVLGRNLGDFSADLVAQQSRLEALAARLQNWLGVDGPPWTFRTFLSQLEPAAILRGAAEATQSLSAWVVLTLTYLAFLFPTAAAFNAKLPAVLPDEGERKRAREMIQAVGSSVQRYLVVQTVISAAIAILSFATLSVIGLSNALFWAFLIFLLNYIPTIGSIVAVALPTLFAAVQFSTWEPVAAVALGLHVWQFGIGNFVQPRLTGDTLNLSTLVVLLSLAIWGGLWGLVGVFLAAPLTVLVMTILAQFRSTYWIAALLSADGRPLGRAHAAARASPA